MDISWSWSASRGSDVLVLNKVLSSSNAMRCVPVAARCFCTASAPLFLREGVGAVAMGSVTGEAGRVVLETLMCGHRMVDVPQGELLPRIC